MKTFHRLVPFLSMALLIGSCQEKNQRLVPIDELKQQIHTAIDSIKAFKNYALFDKIIEQNALSADLGAQFALADSCRTVGKIALAANTFEGFTTARSYFTTGITLLNKAHSDSNQLHLILLFNTGISYSKQHDYSNAIKNHNAVNQVISKYRLDTLQAYNALYLNNGYETARIYSVLGETELSHNTFSEIYKAAKNTSKNTELIIKIATDYTSLLRKEKLYEAAQRVALEGIELCSTLNTDKKSYYLAGLYLNIANCMQEWNHYGEAEKYYVQAISNYKIIEDSAAILKCSMNRGESLRKNKQFKQAHALLSQQIESFEKQPISNPSEQGDRIGMYINRGETLYDLKNYQDAQKDYLKALKYLNFGLNTEGVLPTLESFKGDRFDLLMTLNDMALTYIQLKEKEKALMVYDTLSKLINLIRQDYMGDNEKLGISGKTRHILEKAINVCVELYRQYGETQYLEQAFNFSEQSKAMVLLENVKLKLTAQLPDDIKQKLAKNKFDINNIEKQLAENPQNQGLLNQKKMLDGEKINIWYTIKSQINSVYNTDSLWTCHKIQTQLLAENQALLEYFIEEDSNRLHIFVVRKNQPIEYRAMVLNSDFNKNIDSVQHYLAQQSTAGQGVYCQNAHALYKILIEPVKNILPQRLIIVPEYPLSKIPFEALVSNTQASTYEQVHQQGAFLVQQYAICYNYSANLHALMQTAHENGNKSDKIAAFAPTFKQNIKDRILSFSDSVTLKPIPSNENEVDKISQYARTEVFKGEKANKKVFLDMAQNSTILHISTHGVLVSQPKFNFIGLTQATDNLNTNEVLFLSELFDKSLPHLKLVFLSACETATSSTVYKGEGAISMSWGLALAGVQSFVTTLWSVNAQATSQLTPQFYKALKDNPKMTKDAALMYAKNQYMSDEKTHPFYWAGFVLVGNTEGVNLENPASTSNLFYVFGGIIALFSGWVIYRKRK
jgi:CHAT domain-containing protein